MVLITQDVISALFDEHADMVYRIALNIVKNREEAQN